MARLILDHRVKAVKVHFHSGSLFIQSTSSAISLCQKFLLFGISHGFNCFW